LLRNKICWNFSWWWWRTYYVVFK